MSARAAVHKSHASDAAAGVDSASKRPSPSVREIALGHRLEDVSLEAVPRVWIPAPSSATEREARGIADRVVAAGDVTHSAPPAIANEDGHALGKRDARAFAWHLSAARGGPGAGLPDEVRDETERAVGGPLGDVRLRRSAAADRATSLLGADAVNVGRDVLVRRSAFDPTSADGRELIVHEAVHAGLHGALTARMNSSGENTLVAHCGKRKNRKADERKTDVKYLERLADSDDRPEITRRVLREVLENLPSTNLTRENVTNSRAQRRGDSNEEHDVFYTEKPHRYDPAENATLENDAAFRGALVHELTHVAVDKAYDNPAFFTFLPGAKDKDFKTLLERRQKHLTKLKQLLREDTTLDDAQTGYVLDRLVYSSGIEDEQVTRGCGPFSRKQVKQSPVAKLSAATAILGKFGFIDGEDSAAAADDDTVEMLKRAGAFVNAGGPTRVAQSGVFAEYDSVINQLLFMMGEWDVDEAHPLYLKLQEVAQEAFDEREAARDAQ